MSALFQKISLAKMVSVTSLVVLLALSLSVNSVIAQSGTEAPSKPVQTLHNPLGDNLTLAGFISNAVDVFSYIAILFAVAAFIWVGFKFVIARGNSDKMKEARDWFGYIVIGVAIIIGARLILSIIINTLSATGMVNKGVINSAQNALKNN